MINEKLIKNRSPGFWIGGSKKATTTVVIWEWSDGAVWNFTNWDVDGDSKSRGETGRFLMMQGVSPALDPSHHGKWTAHSGIVPNSDPPSRQKAFFLCKYQCNCPPPPPPPPRATTTTTEPSAVVQLLQLLQPLLTTSTTTSTTEPSAAAQRLQQLQPLATTPSAAATLNAGHLLLVVPIFVWIFLVN